MAKTLEKEVVAAIELAIIAAQSAGRHPDLHAIAAIFNCTYQTVCYIRRRIEKHQRTGVDDRKKAGRKPLANQDKIAESIRGLLARRPELDQSAICDYIFDEFGVRLGQATVSRILKKNAIPHKVSNRLYQKSKLCTTSKSKSGIGEVSQKAAANVSSSLPKASDGTHKSPFDSGARLPGDTPFNGLPVMPPANVSFDGTAGESDTRGNNQPMEVEIVMGYSNPYS
jgi:transposase